jgi:hypothetical protein
MDDRVRRAVIIAFGALVALAAACGGRSKRVSKAAVRDSASVDSALSRAAEDTSAQAESVAIAPVDTSARPPAVAPPPAPPPEMSPLADSISQFVVFVPTSQTWFVVASRAKRALLDLGRVDADVKTKPRIRAAYLEAVRKLSPVPIGTRFRLFTANGQDSVTVKGFDVWNGRVVATLTAPKSIDSIARAAPLFVASAFRVDTTTAPVDTTHADSVHRDSVRKDSIAHRDSILADTCRRGNVPDSLKPRVLAIRDSLIMSLESLPPPPYPRLVKSEHPQWSTIVGCFGGPRHIAMAVDLRAGNNEWIRERIVLIDTLGKVTTLRVSDLRFKGHDLLLALDADGDGLDDLATRGFAEASGGITILKLTDKGRLQRLANGFAWEAR